MASLKTLKFKQKQSKVDERVFYCGTTIPLFMWMMIGILCGTQSFQDQGYYHYKLSAPFDVTNEGDIGRCLPQSQDCEVKSPSGFRLS
jgi:hypothetical protein